MALNQDDEDFLYPRKNREEHAKVRRQPTFGEKLRYSLGETIGVGLYILCWVVGIIVVVALLKWAAEELAR